MENKKADNNKKTLYRFGLASFFNDIGSEIIFSVLPFYIVSLGGNSIAIGIIAAIKESLDKIIKVLSGYYADKLNKRMFFVNFGYAISAIFKFLAAFAPSWQSLAAIMAIERSGKGIRDSPRDALISFYAKKHVAEGFAINRALDTAGAIIGSLIAFWLFYSGYGFREIIMFAGLFAFLSLIPLIGIKDFKDKVPKDGIVKTIVSFDNKIKKGILIASLFYIANISYMFLLLYTFESLNIENSLQNTLALYVIFNVAFAFSALPLAKIIDKIDKKHSLLLCFFLYSLFWLVFPKANNTLMFFFLFIAYGILKAFLEISVPAFINSYAKEMKSTVFGLLSSSVGFSMIVGNILAGIVWSLDKQAVFYMSFFFSFLAFLILSKDLKRF